MLGKQADVASIQLGEAMPQIKAGKVTPIVIFAKERNQYMTDVPTATEAGYEVQVTHQRAIAAPKGTPAEVQATLKGRPSAPRSRTRSTRTSTPASC